MHIPFFGQRHFGIKRPGKADNFQPFAPAMDCLGLAVEWEKCDSLRERIREEKKVLIYPEEDKYCKANRVNSVVNGDVLIPILKRLGATEGNKLPYIEELTAETTTLHQKCGLSCSDKAPYKLGVELKRLAGFIKRRAYRKEVTKEKGSVRAQYSLCFVVAYCCIKESKFNQWLHHVAPTKFQIEIQVLK